MSKIVWFDGSDPEMDAAAREARRTFRYFWREMTWEYRRIIPGLDVAAVKAPFTHREAPGLLGRLFGGAGDPPVEHMWVSDVTFDGSVVRGALLNAPHALRGWKAGDAVEIPLDRLSDWMYAIGGAVYGAHTVQLIRRRMDPAERAAHDAAWGLDFGDPAAVRLVPEWGRADPDVEHPMSQNILAKWEEQLAGPDGRGASGRTATAGPSSTSSPSAAASATSTCCCATAPTRTRARPTAAPR